MDLTINNNNTTLLTTTKTPEPETKIQQPKPLSFCNGVLKLHNHHHAVVVNYKECLKNHAATIGGHALDGCGEFMPSTAAYSAGDPTSLKCAACGCHRNFHRREPEEPLSALEYQPHHRHHPPPPLPAAQRGNSSPNSLSPPPISSAYYPSAPHMLLALSTGFSGPQFETHPPISNSLNPNSSNLTISNGKKRFRTKFTQPQKAKMLEFAEKVGWRMQRRDEELINEVCREVGVERGVLKVWMHNNKNNFNKRDQPAGAAAVDGGATADDHQNGNADFNGNINNTRDNTDLDFHLHNGDSTVRAGHVVATNGSSSSS